MAYREGKKTLRDARSELKKLSKAEREELLPREPVSFCVVGGRKCRYLFSYKGYQLCHYEVNGKGCVVEKGKTPLTNSEKPFKEGRS